MTDIAQRGNKLTRTGYAKGGRTGHAKGGRAGFASAGQVLKHAKKLVNRVTHEVPTGPHTDVRRRKLNKKWQRKKLGVSPEMKATLKGIRGKPLHNPQTRDVPTMAAKGGRAGHFAGSLVKNIPKLLKKLGTEIKDAPLPPQLQKTLDEVKKLQKLQKPIVKKAAGGRIGKKHGFQVLGGGVEGKPHSTYEGRNEAGRRKFKRLIGEDPGKRNRDFGKTAGRMARAARKKDFKTHGKDVPTMAAEGGRAGHAIGGIALSAKRALGKLKKPSGVFKKGKKTHGKDVPTMAATGGRIGSKGLKK